MSTLIRDIINYGNISYEHGEACANQTSNCEKVKSERNALLKNIVDKLINISNELVDYDSLLKVSNKEVRDE